MANDPNSDLLPVKDTNYRFRGINNDKFDHQTVSKIAREELEDKYLRVSDENSELKKLVHIQEEKIKKIGTKLSRIVNDKKNGPNSSSIKQYGDNGLMEELKMKIIELEHKNYGLRDKNVVLKQQLASHVRRHSTHRSPGHTITNSPLMSQRQPFPNTMNETSYDMPNQAYTAELQLREAEAHISEQNEEIKSLLGKIESLEHDLEKRSLENKKSVISENIEVIRLQRTLKKQSIQLAALQVQLKASEDQQKLLEEDLSKAQQENDNALQIISEKQKEIMELSKTLVEVNVSRLEQEELKERLNDLLTERESLRDRSELLLKAISSQANNAESVAELKNLLEIERAQKKDLQETLEKMKMDALALGSQKTNAVQLTYDPGVKKSPSAAVYTQTSPPSSASTIRSTPRSAQQNELDLLTSTQLRKNELERFLSMRGCTSLDNNFTSKIINLLTAQENKPEPLGNKFCSVGESERDNINIRHKSTTSDVEIIPSMVVNMSQGIVESSPQLIIPNNQAVVEKNRIHIAEKLKMERELEYMRQMLRSQTQRCETQDQEISRLNYELRLNEEKYTDTVKRLDVHLKIFQHLEQRMSQEEKETVQRREDEEKEMTENTKDKPVPTPRSILSTGKKSTENDGTIENELVPSDTQTSVNEEQTEELSHEVDKLGSENKDNSTIMSVSSDEDDVQINTITNQSIKGQLEARESLSSLPKMSSDSVQGSPLRTIQEKSKKVLKRESAIVESAPSSPVQNGDNQSNSSRKQDIKGSIKPLRRLSMRSINPVVCVTIQSVQLIENTCLSNNKDFRFLFIDFSFLDITGEDTETPSSVEVKYGDNLDFNYTSKIEMTQLRLNLLRNLLNKSDLEVIVFKIVSDPADLPEDVDCVEVGSASITTNEFLLHSNSQTYMLPVYSESNEIIGNLTVSLDIPAEVMQLKKM